MKMFLSPENDGDLERIIRYNLGQASQLRRKIKNLDRVIIENHSNNVITNQETVIQEDTEIYDNDEEYLYYYENLLESLKNVKEENVKRTMVSKCLPNINNKNYVNIIKRIKLELLKEIYEFEIMKNDEQELIDEINQEISSIRDLIQIIEEVQVYKIDESISASVINEKNTLIFLQTHNGSICIENDLYSISPEYYESFKELILSIEDGTFKNVKRFTSNNLVLKGICEVKGFKERIVFDKINENIYIVIYAFVKKSDNDKGYLDSLKNRIDYYKKNKSLVLEKLKEDNYLVEQQDIYYNLKKGLSEKNIIKTMKRS